VLSDLTLTLAISLLWLSTLAFIVFYLWRLRAVTKEYMEARGIVEGIVTTFKRRYDQLSTGMQQLRTQVSSTQLKTQEMVDAAAHLSRRVEDTLAFLEKAKTGDKGLMQSVTALQEDVKQLREMQKNIQSKLSSISNPTPAPSSRSEISKADSAMSIDSKLTDTENIVLQFLITEGPKTARQVEAKIGRTREHTARLMKKLWEEGYIERETHKIPFTYRVAGALRNLEKPST